MAIYAISDLHLSFETDKPMDVFGESWDDYIRKIHDNWIATINENDTVIIPGDISWATYLKDAYKDFLFIDSLPGTKLILKGNHDYWWTTVSKMEKFLLQNGFKSINLLHNKSIMIGRNAVCGARGWKSPSDKDFTQEDEKLYARELSRLELSLMDGAKNRPDKIIVAIHFPPFGQEHEKSEFVRLMNKYGTDICVYGHLHGEALKNAFTGKLHDIEFKAISADHLGFKPLLI